MNKEKKHLKNLIKNLKFLYFDYMINTDETGTYDRFKKFHIEIVDELLDRINDKYADHVENLKNEKIKLLKEITDEKIG